jgi:RNA polymerase sigma-70 factor (ECF subfamily)
MADPGEAAVVRLPERFEAFYEREYHRVLGLAYAVAGSWEAAEDATQEAFLRAHRDWQRVGHYDQPGAWVRRVAANLAVSAFRRALAEARAVVRLAARRQPDPPLHAEALDFWRAVRSLPARQRQAIALFYLEDWPTAEIARFLGCTETTVRGHLHLGRAALAVTVATAVLWQGLAPTGHPDGARPPALPGVPGLDRHVRDAIPIGRAAGTDLVAGPDAVWVLNRNLPPDQDQLVRVDPATDRVVARIPVGRNALRVAVGDGSVWVLRATSGRVDLVQVDPATNRVDKTSPPLGATSRRDRGVTERLLVAGRVVWAVTGAGVIRYDPAAGTVVEVAGPERVGPVSGLAVAGGSIWVVSGMVVFKLRPGDGTVLQSDAPKELTPMIPSGLAAGAGSLWVAGSGHLARLDAGTGRVAAVVQGRPRRRHGRR